MDKSYIAGFFDGEGSAIVITVRSELMNGAATYTFRPIISISQKTMGVLKELRDTLGYGHLDKGRNAGKYIINSRGNIIRFVDDIMPYTFLKTRQLKLLKEFAIFKGPYGGKGMYSKDVLERMIDYRDEIHQLNTLTRSNIHLKYSKDFILNEYSDELVNSYRANRRDWAIELGKTQGEKNRSPRRTVACECGCGQTFETPTKHYTRPKRFISGHNQRGKHWTQGENNVS
jgi:hypothetical protein